VAKTARYVLPATIDPADSVCFQVQVPNDPQHIAAFKGQILDLTWSRLWQHDATNGADQTSRVWKRVFDNLTECDVINIRLKPTNFCMIQLTNDGGATWTDVADLSACANAAAVDYVQQRIDYGTLSGGGQQPGQGGGTPTQCYDYDITLTGSQRWNSPVAVETDDIITVTNAQGAWFDGDLLSLQWNCPDGTPYSLGTCVGSTHLDAGDPLPTSPHMMLVGNIPGATVPYFDMYNTTYTVPASVPSSELFLQANDGVLTDNQGSINLHVQICKGGWVHAFDFTGGSDEGWLPWSALNSQGAFSPEGWQSVPQGSPGSDYAYFYRTFPSTRDVVNVHVHLTQDIAGTTGRMGINWNATAYTFHSGDDGHTGTDFDFGPHAAVDHVFLAIEKGDSSAIWSGVGTVVISGTGTDPF
jgi:hypothetical protein